MNLSEDLLRKARAVGLCQEHTDKWNVSWSKKDLLRYYKANPNWCLKRQFPSLGYLRKYFKGGKARDMGVFIDEKNIALRPTSLIYVLVNSSMGILTNRIQRFYLGLDSNVTFIVQDGGDITIDYYDNSKVKVELRGDAKCTIYRYGDNEPVITGNSNNIRIRDKR